MTEQAALKPDNVLRPTGDVLQVSDCQLAIFEIPETGDTYDTRLFERVAVDNTEGFIRLVKGGLDALEDGERISFAGVSSFNHASTLRTVSRGGDTFFIDDSDNRDANEGTVTQVPSAETPEAPLLVTGEEINEFFIGLSTNFSYHNHMAEFVAQGGNLGEFCKALGYSDNDQQYPLPRILQDNIRRIRAEGDGNIPNIKILETGSIPGEIYVQAWAAGEFPISGNIGWFGHDATQDHMRALIVFGNEAMKLAQLYAQAVLSSETITARIYPSEYEINKLEPQKIEVSVGGAEKVNAASLCLDQFTSELDGLNGDLATDPFSEALTFAPEHMDVIAEMVHVVMQSPEHCAQLMQQFEAAGSTAITGGVFSYETFLRETLARAQQYWNITPQAPVHHEEIDAVPEQSNPIF